MALSSTKLQRALGRYLDRTGESQMQLAEAIGVDQATISRACRGVRQRRTKTYDLICAYMRQQPDWAEPNTAIGALNEVWDNTDQHDAALAGLILASKDLWPDLRKGPDGDG